MQTLSKSQFKSQMLSYLRKIEHDNEPLIITHAGKPVIKVSSYQEDPDSLLAVLKNSVVTYKKPLEPIGQNDWENA